MDTSNFSGSTAYPGAIHVTVDDQVAMRDGLHLSTDVYLPRASDQSSTAKFPCVLIRTPYNNGSTVNIRKARSLADAGYACVLQDVRGRWDSDGSWDPFLAEAEDGYDTQTFIRFFYFV